MYKNQLQELAQRSCFNLPSYASIREGPDHAPRFKASVNFNGEIFESPYYSTTLRHAEHSAAEVALNSLSSRGPSKSLTARVLDETGVYKNLLQETAHRAGLELPVYTTVRSGPGHVPTFTSSVEIAGINFSGEAAKTKKQAEKNAAITAWSALKTMPNFGCLSSHSTNKETRQDQDHAIVAKVLSSLRQRNQSRVMRRKDHQYHQQPRRRTMLQQQQQRMMMPHNQQNPVELDFSFGQKHKNSFLSLLPPPPPRTISKILPPNLSTPQQPLYQPSRCHEQQKWDDNNGWINKLSEAIKKKHVVEVDSSSSGNSTSFLSDPTVNNAETQKISCNLDPTATPSQIIPRQITIPPLEAAWNQCSSSYSSQMGIGMGRSSAGFSGTTYFAPPQRIAQAVQIRSVIPVCATPPVRMIRPPSLQTSSVSATETDLTANLSQLKL